jgi:tetratricopeptide (TPR) repeat protein
LRISGEEVNSFVVVNAGMNEHRDASRPWRRNVAGGGAALALLVLSTAAVLAWRARVDPAAGFGWSFGSPAAVLDDRAREEIREAIELLQDPQRPGPERMRGYRASLTRAEALLVRSLRGRPADARALALLAAVRFELDPTSPHAARRTLETIDLASSLAPQSGRIQQDLAELLVRMGHTDIAARYYARVVELTPDRTETAVDALVRAGLAPEEVLDALPRTAGVLAAARAAFVSAHGAEAYLDRVESLFGSASAALEPELIAAYADTALAGGFAERLVTRLGSMPPLADPDVEAWRRLALGRGVLALGRREDAIAHAEAALDLRPESLRLASAAGSLALAGGRPDRAVAAFQSALRLSARHGQGSSATVRARLYAQIGAAEEARGNTVAAFDAYTLSLRLDPESADARRRLDKLSSGSR